MKRKNIFSGKRKLSKDNAWKVVNSSTGPSTKMSKLSPWIESDVKLKNGNLNEGESISLNENLIKDKFVENFSQSFANRKSYEAENVKLYNDPFQVSVVNDFLLDPSIIPKLIEEEMDKIEWTRKQMDLYEFYQTTDLANIDTPYLSKFYNFINVDVRNWMEKLTGMKFKRVSASCSMYDCGDFLLSHDDLLSDRLIAFVFYLSPWENTNKWDESMGGALELFGCNTEGQPIFPVAKKIFPANNQLSFFKVEKISHHQVGEVLTKDYPRLTINGWFHGFKNNPYYDSDAIKIKNPNVPIFKQPKNDIKNNFEMIINKSYFKDSIKKGIQNQIEENSEAGLGVFLNLEFISMIEQELSSKKIKWCLKGPANQQNYEAVQVDSLPKNSNIKHLLDLFASKEFFRLLHEYTELDFYGDNSNEPKCTVELQRWKRGCYTLIGDPSTYNNDSLDLILYIGSNENAGIITYLTPDGKDNESVLSNDDDEDSALLTIYPQNNFLNLVYRSSGTAKFTKYCYKSTVMTSDFNYILQCSYIE